MKITVYVSIGLVGCRREATIEVDDDATEEDIEEEAQEAMLQMVQWHWEKSLVSTKTGRRK